MDNFIDILAIILILRRVSIPLFLVSFSRVTVIRKSRTFKVCKDIKKDPWTYRLFWLSALWLIVQYKDLI